MRRWWIISAAALVLAVIGGGIAWRLHGRGPGRASVGGAISRLRTSSTVRTSAARLQPRPGVYVYKATGHESLSFMGTRQTQGPTNPGTVVLRPNGCWEFRMDFNSFHQQSWSYCSSGEKLVESGGTTDQQFDFVAFSRSEHTDVTCKPPTIVADLTAVPGASSPVHCTGRSHTTKATFVQTGAAVYVGRETVAVGGVSVPALHTRERLRVSRDQTGTVDVDLWFAASDGLPLKEAHNIRVVSPAPAPINHVTYTERGRWQLTSLTPQT